MTECCTTSVPLLKDIMTPIAGISPDVPVRDVVGIFQQDQTLLALPVVDRDRFVGVINRKVLIFKHLGRPYTMDLYGRKPISVLLEECPLVMDAALDVNSALERLVSEDPALESDSFPVMEGDRCIGIASVAELMMSISRLQAGLLQTLRCLTARIREEVAIASRVQQDLLPFDAARFGAIDINAGMATSTEIGGDFYDYVQLDNGTVCIVMGDVSGHGVQAGMVTTAAKASLHTLIAAGITTPRRLLQGMNNAILATARRNLLMTCVIITVDQRRRTMTIANGGHTFPYVLRSSAPEPCRIEEVSGFPLGLEPDGTYTENALPFEPGDRLFVYTDGIIEASDMDGDQYGLERLEAFLHAERHTPPQDLRQHLFDSLNRFTSTGTYDDDVTFLTVHYTIDEDQP